MWLSPGARLGFAVVICLLALVVVFGVIPAQSARQKQDRNDRLNAIAAQKADRLLHNFDCTYGIALRTTLREAERSNLASAHNALLARRNNLHMHNPRAAAVNLRSFHNALQAAHKYRTLRLSLFALDQTPTPCR